MKCGMCSDVFETERDLARHELEWHRLGKPETDDVSQRKRGIREARAIVMEFVEASDSANKPLLYEIANHIGDLESESDNTSGEEE